MSDSNVVNFARTATIAAVSMMHPAISAAEQMRMSPHELLYFTDTPVAHVAAFRDFQREMRLEAARIDAANAYLARRRVEAHEARG